MKNRKRKDPKKRTETFVLFWRSRHKSQKDFHLEAYICDAENITDAIMQWYYWQKKEPDIEDWEFWPSLKLTMPQVRAKLRFLHMMDQALNNPMNPWPPAPEILRKQMKLVPPAGAEEQKKPKG